MPTTNLRPFTSTGRHKTHCATSAAAQDPRAQNYRHAEETLTLLASIMSLTHLQFTPFPLGTLETPQPSTTPTLPR
eukprot:2389259-Pyramimonas_sp.AAC.1